MLTNINKSYLDLPLEKRVWICLLQKILYSNRCRCRRRWNQQCDTDRI